MYVTIDIGGTNTRIAHSEDLQNLSEIERFPTPEDFTTLKYKINSYIEKLNGVKAVSVGVAGIIDRTNKIIVKCPHIPYLKAVPILQLITLPSFEVYLENDATLACLAEATRGSAQNFENVAYITISTGVGGALISNKKIPPQRFNHEPGHHVINMDETFVYKEKLSGTWEGYSSGTAFGLRIGKSPADIDDPKVWADYGEILAYGLHNIHLLWQPDVIVLGGSLSRRWNLFGQSLMDKFNTMDELHVPEVKISKFGDENGLIGGLELIRGALSN